MNGRGRLATATQVISTTSTPIAATVHQLASAGESHPVAARTIVARSTTVVPHHISSSRPRVHPSILPHAPSSSGVGSLRSGRVATGL